VLYEMVTGALPFRGESSGVIFDGILNRAAVAIDASGIWLISFGGQHRRWGKKL